MGTRIRSFFLAAGVLLVAVGCASSDEWAVWRWQTAHFASGKHMVFSMKNQKGSTPRVSREDISVAGNESWWGMPVLVSQEQILE